MRSFGSARLTFTGLAIFIIMLAFLSLPIWGQSRNPIQAARDAINNAKQQQQKQQPAQPAQNQRGAQANATAAAATAPAATGGDCCGPDALKALAGVNGKLDIVGVKLGMTFDEAIAAIKAANSKLKIDILDAELDVAGKKMKIHRWVLAHTSGVANSNFYHSADGSEEAIALELTMPPNTQVVDMVSRYVGFANTSPVAASTLTDALRKKYGTENSLVDKTGSLSWVFDASGKQVSGTITHEMGYCVEPNAVDQFPVEMRGGDDTNPARIYTSYYPNTIMNLIQGRLHLQASCAPYTVVVASDLAVVAPNAPQNHLWVGMYSDAMMVRSLPITQAYLQKAVEDQQKQTEDAAKQRTAPKL